MTRTPSPEPAALQLMLTVPQALVNSDRGRRRCTSGRRRFRRFSAVAVAGRHRGGCLPQHDIRCDPQSRAARPAPRPPALRPRQPLAVPPRRAGRVRARHARPDGGALMAASHQRVRVAPNLYRRGDGVYVAGLTVAGRWTMKTLAARTKREAKLELAALQLEVAQTRAIGRRRSSASPSWRRSSCAGSRRRSTRASAARARSSSTSGRCAAICVPPGTSSSASDRPGRGGRAHRRTPRGRQTARRC